jgi:AI-2 transport protein TqsA
LSLCSDIGKIDLQIQNYIVLKSLISALAGLAVFVILDIVFNIPMAFLFSFLTFIFNFIPNLGAIIASLLPLPIIVLDPDLSEFSKLLAFGLPVLVHLVVGNVIEPLVFGEKLELHPIVVLLSLAFWYAMWGVPGAILSVPITAVLRIIFSHVRHPYAASVLNLLEGRLFDLVAESNKEV